MSARQPEKHSQWTPLRVWHRLSLRWKMTLVGGGMGAFASSLWTTPCGVSRPQQRVHKSWNRLRDRDSSWDSRYGGAHALLWNQAGEGPK